jgi:hypothetical protein
VAKASEASAEAQRRVANQQARDRRQAAQDKARQGRN